LKEVEPKKFGKWMKMKIVVEVEKNIQNSSIAQFFQLSYYFHFHPLLSSSTKILISFTIEVSNVFKAFVNLIH
jgi:hypothetical protein